MFTYLPMYSFNLIKFYKGNTVAAEYTFLFFFYVKELTGVQKYSLKCLFHIAK